MVLCKLLFSFSCQYLVQMHCLGQEELCEEGVLLQLRAPAPHRSNVSHGAVSNSAIDANAEAYKQHQQQQLPSRVYQDANASKVKAEAYKQHQQQPPSKTYQDANATTAKTETYKQHQQQPPSKVYRDSNATRANTESHKQHQQQQPLKEHQVNTATVNGLTWQTNAMRTEAPKAIGVESISHGFLHALTEPTAALCIAFGGLVFVGLCETTPEKLSFVQGRLAVSLLAALSFVGANFFAEACLHEFRFGLMDLIYARCAALAFAGLLLMRLHPDRPSFFPNMPGHSTLLLLAAWGASACTMLYLAGLVFAPASLVMLALAVQTSFSTALKRVFLMESPDWEEGLCSLGLLLATVPLLACAASAGAEADGVEPAMMPPRLRPALSWLTGTIFGISASLAAAGSALSQRQLCGRVHHTTLATWTGLSGLVLLVPVAVAYPEQAKMLHFLSSVQAPQVAVLSAFAALSVIAAVNLGKAANIARGLEAEPAHLLVVGLSCCMQYAFDTVRFGADRYGSLGRLSISLLMIGTLVSYMLHLHELRWATLRCATACRPRQWQLHLEPQHFQSISTDASLEHGCMVPRGIRPIR